MCAAPETPAIPLKGPLHDERRLFYLRAKVTQPFQPSGTPDQAKATVCALATTKQVTCCARLSEVSSRPLDHLAPACTTPSQPPWPVQDAQFILQQLSPSYDVGYANRVQSVLGLACGQYRLPSGQMTVCAPAVACHAPLLVGATCVLCSAASCHVVQYEGLEAASDCGVVGWSAFPPAFCSGAGSTGTDSGR